MVRDQNSDHIVCKLLRKKGYTSFDVYNSKHKNQYGGWWVEGATPPLPRGCEGFLGVTLKDALFTLRHTNEIPLTEEKIDELTENLFNKMFDRYYPPNHSIFDSDYTMDVSKSNAKFLIRKYLEAGEDVKTGYAPTSVQGAHDHLIFHKSKQRPV